MRLGAQCINPSMEPQRTPGAGCSGSSARLRPTHFENDTLIHELCVLPSFSLFNGHRPHKKRIYCIIKSCIYITVQFAHQVVNENRRFYVVTQMLRTHIWVFRPPNSSSFLPSPTSSLQRYGRFEESAVAIVSVVLTLSDMDNMGPIRSGYLNRVHV